MPQKNDKGNEAIRITREGTPLAGNPASGGFLHSNAREITERLICMGAAGVNIEDQVFPKHCGHMEGKQVIDAKEMAGEVRGLREYRQLEAEHLTRLAEQVRQGDRP